MFRMRRFRAFAALTLLVLLNAVASAEPISLVTPMGLNPGDRFRFAFVTNGSFYGSTGTIDAQSSNIADYNSFVTAQAAGALFQGSTVTWKAIGSTATVNARDNVGGFGTLVPVYLVSGTRIADDLTDAGTGFWSGSLLEFTKLNLSIDGSSVNSYVWTGSNADGTTYSGYELGSGGYTGFGDSNSNGGFTDYGDDDASYTAPMFEMSGELTVAAVPEIDPAGMGSVAALVTGALGLLERRKRRAA